MNWGRYPQLSQVQLAPVHHGTPFWAPVAVAFALFVLAYCVFVFLLVAGYAIRTRARRP